MFPGHTTAARDVSQCKGEKRFIPGTQRVSLLRIFPSLFWPLGSSEINFLLTLHKCFLPQTICFLNFPTLPRVFDRKRKGRKERDSLNGGSRTQGGGSGRPQASFSSCPGPNPPPSLHSSGPKKQSQTHPLAQREEAANTRFLQLSFAV